MAKVKRYYVDTKTNATQLHAELDNGDSELVAQFSPKYSTFIGTIAANLNNILLAARK